MSLVADYSDTSSSSSESDSSDRESEQKVAAVAKKPILPKASALFSNESKTGEVFQTKYHKEEQAKKLALERHVKMVENDEHLTTKNGRKICCNFRKGRCRFGTKCQYAHDSDLSTETLASSSDKSQSGSRATTTAKANKQAFTSGSYEATDAQNNQEDTNQSLKRKRPGLGDSIAPGKRVMKAYKQHNK